MYSYTECSPVRSVAQAINSSPGEAKEGTGLEGEARQVGILSSWQGSNTKENMRCKRKLKKT